MNPGQNSPNQNALGQYVLGTNRNLKRNYQAADRSSIGTSDWWKRCNKVLMREVCHRSFQWSSTGTPI